MFSAHAQRCLRPVGETVTKYDRLGSVGSRIKARDSVKGRYGWADSGWRMADIHFSKKIKSKKKREGEKEEISKLK